MTQSEMLHHRPMVIETGLVGLFGLIGMTWIFPATGRLITSKRLRVPSRRRESSEGVVPHESVRLSILIPAHNEEQSILETLQSVDLAVKAAAKSRSGLVATITVGADGCTDRTSEIARAFGAQVIESSPGLGKWGMLNALARSSESADWIAFVDCGAIWEPALLEKCLHFCDDKNVLGVAPAYRNPTAGVLEGLSWAMESTLKRMEDQAGGPVSVHGATVLYRRPELIAALDHLSSSSWLNDDVVIPFTLRILNPRARIRYAHEARVCDSATAHAAKGAVKPREFGRRRRMVQGNIQWIRNILPEGVRKNPTVAYLALRRVFRLFWAWWGLVALAPFLFVGARIAWRTIYPESLPMAALAGTVTLVLGLAVAFRLRRPLIGLIDAAAASLLAPFFFFGGADTRWK